MPIFCCKLCYNKTINFIKEIKIEPSNSTIEIQNQEPKKTSKAPVIVAGVASALAVAGLAFGIFGLIKSQSSNQQTSAPTSQENNTSNDNTEVSSNGTNPTITLPEIRSLLEKYIAFDYITYGKNLFSDGLTEDYKYILALKNLDFENRVSEKSEEPPMVHEYDFTYDELNDSYHELFGSLTDLKQRTSGGCFVPYFSEEYNKYISFHACGGLDPTLRSYNIVDYNIENENLVVTAEYLQITPGSTNGEETSILLNNGEEIALVANGMKTYFNELPKYKLIFTKENNKYILASVEKSN